MADIKPAEISAIIKKQLTGSDIGPSLAEVGTVLQVGDGIARVYGLSNVQYGELVKFENKYIVVARTIEINKPRHNPFLYHFFLVSSKICQSKDILKSFNLFLPLYSMQHLIYLLKKLQSQMIHIAVLPLFLQLFLWL